MKIKEQICGRKGKGKEEERSRKEREERKERGRGKEEERTSKKKTTKEEEKRKRKQEGTKRQKEAKKKEEEAASLIAEEERKRTWKEEGSICGLRPPFEQMGISKVSLGISLLSPLSCAQLCVNQLQMQASLLGGLSLHSVSRTFQTRSEQSGLPVYQSTSFDRTSYVSICPSHHRSKALNTWCLPQISE